MIPFGPHITIDASGCNRTKLANVSLVYDILNNLPGKVGMTKMTLPYVVKWLDPGAIIEGISGFVMIAESHISIHTFPEKDYAFIDIFSCKQFKIETAVKYIVEAFEAKRFIKKIIKRGLDFPRADPHHLYQPSELAIKQELSQ